MRMPFSYIYSRLVGFIELFYDELVSFSCIKVT